MAPTSTKGRRWKLKDESLVSWHQLLCMWIITNLLCYSPTLIFADIDTLVKNKHILFPPVRTMLHNSTSVPVRNMLQITLWEHGRADVGFQMCTVLTQYLMLAQAHSSAIDLFTTFVWVTASNGDKSATRQMCHLEPHMGTCGCNKRWNQADNYSAHRLRYKTMASPRH